MKTRILVSDSFSEEGLELLRAAEGFEVVYKTKLSEDQLKEEIKGIDGLIIRSATKVTEGVLRAANRLKLVARAGVGTDNVDKKAATEVGVIVMNAPSGNSVSTAELAMAMLFSLARKIPQANASMKAGGWEKTKFEGVQLAGKTIGIIGLGRIGSELAKRCHACDMQVLGNDPFLSPPQIEAIGAVPAELEEIYRTADFISVHVPLTDNTRGMIGKKQIEMMKKTMMLINCARGGIMDEAAVAEAVQGGRLAGAAFDVFTEEPPKNSPFVPVENVVMTPHLGASTEEAQVNVAIETAHEVIDFFRNGVIRNSVNVPALDQKLRQELDPYLRLSEKMGGFLSRLAGGSISEVAITFSGTILEQPVYFLTQSVLKGMLDPILSNELNFVNAPVVAKERGIRVSERKEPQVEDFQNLIQVRVTGEKGVNELWGTVHGTGDIRFVFFNDFRFDLAPEGTALVVHNNDVPGVVGVIGTVLGNANINIAGMRLGRKEKGSTVLTILMLDGEVPAPVVQELIGHSDHIIDASVVKMG